MMDSMAERNLISLTRRSRQRSVPALAAVVALWLTGCSASTGESTAAAATPSTSAAVSTTPSTSAAPATVPAVAPTTTVASTTVTSTTRPPITTSPPSTSTSTTTTPTSTTTTLVVEAPVEQQPVPPPPDEYAQEPVIEVGSIVIPKLDVDMTMYEGIRLTTLEHGPGHWPGTAMPGDTGNVVVGGHRTSSHQVFRNVDQLASGDEIIFRDEAGEHTYHVNRVEIVDPSAIWIVDPSDTPTATLFACHPPGSTSQRIVVFADLADSTSG